MSNDGIKLTMAEYRKQIEAMKAEKKKQAQGNKTSTESGKPGTGKKRITLDDV